MTAMENTLSRHQVREEPAILNQEIPSVVESFVEPKGF